MASPFTQITQQEPQFVPASACSYQIQPITRFCLKTPSSFIHSHCCHFPRRSALLTAGQLVPTSVGIKRTLSSTSLPLGVRLHLPFLLVYWAHSSWFKKLSWELTPGEPLVDTQPYLGLPRLVFDGFSFPTPYKTASPLEARAMCQLSLVSNAEHCCPELTQCRTEWGWLKEENPGGQSRRRNQAACHHSKPPRPCDLGVFPT